MNGDKPIMCENMPASFFLLSRAAPSCFLGPTKCSVSHICFQLHITSFYIPRGNFQEKKNRIYKWALLQRPAAPSPQTSNYAHQLLVTEPQVGSVYPPSFLSYSARSCGSLKASLFICCVLQSLTLAQHAKRKPILLFPVVLIGRACCLALH